MGLSLVLHSELVAFISNQNFQFYCATIAYHVELNGESKSVECGSISQFFLDFELIRLE